MRYYLQKFWKLVFLASLFQIVNNGGQVILNLVLIQMFQGIIERDIHRFFFWLSMDCLLFAGMLIFRTLRDYFQNRSVCAMNTQLREDISASLLHKTYQEYHQQDSGEYLSWYTNDVNQIELLAWKPFFELVGVTASVAFSMFALLSLHWSLLAASLATALVMHAAPKLFAKKMEALGETCAVEQAGAVSTIRDLLSGCDVLRFFGKDRRFADGTAEASVRMEAAKFRLSFTQAYAGHGLGMVSIICQLLTNALIGLLSIKGIIIQSALLGGGNLCSSVANGLNTMATLRLSFASARPYFEKITAHVSAEKESLQAMLPVCSSITMEGISFQYDRKSVLRNINVCFEVGKKYAVTGPSGCGKSTLLKILLGWLPDYGGKICFDGQDMKNYTPEQLQQQMSYIEQNVFLFNTTLRENITLGEEFDEAALQKALRESALDRDLEKLPDGLETIVGENGNRLSGGQKQRVAIARALIHNRSILLVDEGTSALDGENADIVETCLLENPNLTLILVSHHLSPERKKRFDHVYEL